MYGLNIEYLKALSFLGFENPLDWSPSPWFLKSRCKNCGRGGWGGVENDRKGNEKRKRSIKKREDPTPQKIDKWWGGGGLTNF